MRILFIGDEEEYAKARAEGESGIPFSLFFYPAPPDAMYQSRFDVMVVPALRFLASPLVLRSIPLIASGPAAIAAECFDLGCQDFIREPWTEGELLARASCRSARRIELGLGGVTIVGKTLTGPAASVELSDDAYDILLLLNGNRGRPVPRSAIAATIGSASSTGRAVDMRIARLRAILRRVGAFDVAGALRYGHGGYRLLT